MTLLSAISTTSMRLRKPAGVGREAGGDVCVFIGAFVAMDAGADVSPGEIAIGVDKAPTQATSARMNDKRTIPRPIGGMRMRQF